METQLEIEHHVLRARSVEAQSKILRESIIKFAPNNDKPYDDSKEKKKDKIETNGLYKKGEDLSVATSSNLIPSRDCLVDQPLNLSTKEPVYEFLTPQVESLLVIAEAAVKHRESGGKTAVSGLSSQQKTSLDSVGDDIIGRQTEHNSFFLEPVIDNVVEDKSSQQMSHIDKGNGSTLVATPVITVPKINDGLKDSNPSDYVPSGDTNYLSKENRLLKSRHVGNKGKEGAITLLENSSNMTGSGNKDNMTDAETTLNHYSDELDCTKYVSSKGLVPNPEYVRNTNGSLDSADLANHESVENNSEPIDNESFAPDVESLLVLAEVSIQDIESNTQVIGSNRQTDESSIDFVRFDSDSVVNVLGKSSCGLDTKMALSPESSISAIDIHDDDGGGVSKKILAVKNANEVLPLFLNKVYITKINEIAKDSIMGNSSILQTSIQTQDPNNCNVTKIVASTEAAIQSLVNSGSATNSTNKPKINNPKIWDKLERPDSKTKKSAVMLQKTKERKLLRAPIPNLMTHENVTFIVPSTTSERGVLDKRLIEASGEDNVIRDMTLKTSMISQGRSREFVITPIKESTITNTNGFSNTKGVSGPLSNTFDSHPENKIPVTQQDRNSIKQSNLPVLSVPSDHNGDPFAHIIEDLTGKKAPKKRGRKRKIRPLPPQPFFVPRSKIPCVLPPNLSAPPPSFTIIPPIRYSAHTPFQTYTAPVMSTNSSFIHQPIAQPIVTASKAPRAPLGSTIYHHNPVLHNTLPLQHLTTPVSSYTGALFNDTRQQLMQAAQIVDDMDTLRQEALLMYPNDLAEAFAQVDGLDKGDPKLSVDKFNRLNEIIMNPVKRDKLMNVVFEQTLHNYVGKLVQQMGPSEAVQLKNQCPTTNDPLPPTGNSFVPNKKTSTNYDKNITSGTKSTSTVISRPVVLQTLKSHVAVRKNSVQSVKDVITLNNISPIDSTSRSVETGIMKPLVLDDSCHKQPLGKVIEQFTPGSEVMHLGRQEILPLAKLTNNQIPSVTTVTREPPVLKPIKHTPQDSCQSPISPEIPLLTPELPVSASTTTHAAGRGLQAQFPEKGFSEGVNRLKLHLKTLTNKINDAVRINRDAKKTKLMKGLVMNKKGIRIALKNTKNKVSKNTQRRKRKIGPINDTSKKRCYGVKRNKGINIKMKFSNNLENTFKTVLNSIEAYNGNVSSHTLDMNSNRTESDSVWRKDLFVDGAAASDCSTSTLPYGESDDELINKQKFMSKNLELNASTSLTNNKFTNITKPMKQNKTNNDSEEVYVDANKEKVESHVNDFDLKGRLKDTLNQIERYDDSCENSDKTVDFAEFCTKIPSARSHKKKLRVRKKKRKQFLMSNVTKKILPTIDDDDYDQASRCSTKSLDILTDVLYNSESDSEIVNNSLTIDQKRTTTKRRRKRKRSDIVQKRIKKEIDSEIDEKKLCESLLSDILPDLADDTKFDYKTVSDIKSDIKYETDSEKYEIEEIKQYNVKCKPCKVVLHDIGHLLPFLSCNKKEYNFRQRKL